VQIDDSRDIHFLINILGCREQIGVDQLNVLLSTESSDPVSDGSIVLGLPIASFKMHGELHAMPLLPAPSRRRRIRQQFDPFKNILIRGIARQSMVSILGRTE